MTVKYYIKNLGRFKFLEQKNPGLTSRGRRLGRGSLPVVSWAAASRAARDPTVVHISADRWPPAPQSAGWTPAWPPGTGRLGSPGQLTEKNTFSRTDQWGFTFSPFLPTSLEQLLSKAFGIGSQLCTNVPLRPCKFENVNRSKDFNPAEANFDLFGRGGLCQRFWREMYASMLVKVFDYLNCVLYLR